MHMVVVVLRPAQLEAVRQALASVHVTRLTVCDAQGYRGPHGDAGVVQESVMEIAVNDDFLERTVETIRRAVQVGEGPAIFVLPMHEAVQIYRDVRGPEAL